MSTCISRHGEYSNHIPDGRFGCTRCGVFDEYAVLAEVDALRAERDEALRAWDVLPIEYRDDAIGAILAQAAALQAVEALCDAAITNPYRAPGTVAFVDAEAVAALVTPGNCHHGLPLAEPGIHLYDGDQPYACDPPLAAGHQPAEAARCSCGHTALDHGCAEGYQATAKCGPMCDCPEGSAGPAEAAAEGRNDE